MHPFPVLDESGRPYDHPFLGGLNAPRPQWADPDADGDADLFLQETSGRVIFFEAVGRPGGPPRYLFRTDRYEGLEVGEWYRFADMDGDGDQDLLAEERFSHIRYYRNVGPASRPRFVLAADSLRDEAGVPIFADRQSIPEVADIDCDGRLDLFLGRLAGTVSRYEEVSRDRDGVPRFRLLTDRFEEIEIVARIGTLHGANALALADADDDGDLDLFWGDFFEPGLLLIENRGSCRHPSLRGEPVPFPVGRPLRTTGYNAPAFGDVDGDGDLDLLVGVIGGAFDPDRSSVENLYFLERTDRGWIEKTRRFLPQIDVGSESVPALGDLDGDGDPELLLANKVDPGDPETSRLYRFANRGTPGAPALQLAGPLELRGDYRYAPALGDLDGDGDPDLVLGSWRDRIALWRNDGTATDGAPRFVLVDPAAVTLTRGSYATPALADVDGDGDLDLLVGESSGTLNFFRNEGTPREPRFVPVTDRYGGIDVGRRSSPALADLDGDGDPELVLGSASGELRLFRNEGTRRAPRFVPAGALGPSAPGLAAPAFADVDGDGDPDLFVGGVGGGLLFYENRGATGAHRTVTGTGRWSRPGRPRRPAPRRAPGLARPAAR